MSEYLEQLFVYTFPKNTNIDVLHVSRMTAASFFTEEIFHSKFQAVTTRRQAVIISNDSLRIL